jgi:hypothetical protein
MDHASVTLHPCISLCQKKAITLHEAEKEELEAAKVKLSGASKWLILLFSESI